MIADLISLSRLALAAAFIRYAAHPPIAVAILCLAGISDWLDGWVARRYAQETRFGAVLDPVCDRLFIIPVLATLVVIHGIAPWQLAVLVARDVVNSAGAAVVWLRYRDQFGRLHPLPSGKAVTSLQFWCVVHIVLGLPWFFVSLSAVALATAWALKDYALQFRRVLGISKSLNTP
jgi:CDP-diacylglycerol--glycerol-3-phosphate 3-phosphatidyltransferase